MKWLCLVQTKVVNMEAVDERTGGSHSLNLSRRLIQNLLKLTPVEISGLWIGPIFFSCASTEVIGFSSIGHIIWPGLWPWWGLAQAGRLTDVLWSVFYLSLMCLGHWSSPTSTYWLLTSQLLFGGDLNISRSTNPIPCLWEGVQQCQCAFWHPW